MPEIISLQREHWSRVREIYKQGLETGQATFEQKVPSWADWDKSHLVHCRFVALFETQVTGWAALSAVSGRCVYGGVAEVSVYVDECFRGRGLGKTLLNTLTESSEANGIWTLEAGIFPENKSSVILHERCGFRKVGLRERIGRLNGEWRDVLLMERRSKRAGL